MIWGFHFIIISLLYLLTKKKNDDLFIKISFIYSVIVFGQRWMTGTDFRNYLLYYLIDFQGNEIGYFFLQNFLKDNNLYFGILIFITFFLSTFNFYRLLTKINHKKKLLIFLFLLSEIYFMQMSQIRQLLAISFILNAFFYSYSGNKLKMFFNIIFSLLFHQSAVFLIPFCFIKIPTSRKFLCFSLLISLFFPLINISTLFYLPIFSRYTNFYLGTVYDVPLGASHIFKYYIIVFLFLIYVFTMEKFENGPIDKMVFTGMILYTIFYGLSIRFAPLYRISNYFKIFEVIFLVLYYNKLNLNINYKFIKGGIISFFIIMYLGLSFTDPYYISNYKFRYLRINEDRTIPQLVYEIDNFYINYENRE